VAQIFMNLRVDFAAVHVIVDACYIVEVTIGQRGSILMNQEEASSPPASCPFCGSAKIATVSKVADSDSYWRCETCGEVWNVARLPAAKRWESRRPWAEKR
jgi:predicted RNA-binding Zn-ribbon protein involved in translation (DUF1610 family)